MSDFGLTNSQVKVYMAALRLGVSTVSAITKSAHMRKEDVYRNLPQLESLGLIEKIIGHPVRIKATSLEQSLSILIRMNQEQTKKKIQTLKTKKAQIIKNFRYSAIDESKKLYNEETFSLISNKELMHKKGCSVIGNTTCELKLAYSKKKLSSLIFSHRSELKAMAKRQVKIRALCDLNGYSSSFRKIVREQLPKINFEIRYVNFPVNHYLVSDNREAMLCTSIEGNLGEYPCLWTTNQNLIGILLRNFEELWKASINEVQATKIGIILDSQVREIRASDHVILIYDSARMKQQILLSFIDLGLKNNEAAIYVASDETPRQIREAMMRYGIAVENHEKKARWRYSITTKFTLRMESWILKELETFGRTNFIVQSESLMVSEL
ncbi:MAG: MEDS domain-containing protein [Candidatus Bathyarchaeota archaeon]|nr:MEDS domain-containing protein [Candidatus Bathyarchaeota archaeon]